MSRLGICLHFILLFVASMGAVIIQGGTRPWSAGPFMMLLFALLGFRFLAACRPSTLEKTWTIPIGGIAWLPVIAMITLRLVWGSEIPVEGRWELLVALALYGTLWLWAATPGAAEHWRAVLGIYFFLVSAVACFGLVGYAQLLQIPGAETLSAKVLRARGPFVSPNHFGHFLLIGMAFASAAIWGKRVRALVKLSAWFCLLTAGVAIVLSGSRSAWFGVLFAVAVPPLIILWKRSKKLFWISVIATPIVLGLIGVLLYLGVAGFQERIDATSAQEDARLSYWADTLRMIASRPVLGVGPGAFRYYYPEFRVSDHVPWFLLRYAHNEPLHVLAEYGLLGLGVFIAALVGLFWTLAIGIKRADASREGVLAAGLCGAWIASLAHSIFDFNLHIFGNMQQLAWLGGLTSLTLAAGGKARHLPRSPRWRKTVPIALVCLAAVGFYMAAMAWHASRAQLRYEAASQKGAHDHALALAMRTAQQHPSFWPAALFVAEEELERAKWKQRDPAARDQHMARAEEYFTKVLTKNPRCLPARYGIARIAANRGEFQSALEIMEEVVLLHRFDAFYWIEYGRMLREAGRLRDAATAFRTGLDFNPYDQVLRTNLNLANRRLRTQNE